MSNKPLAPHTDAPRTRAGSREIRSSEKRSREEENKLAYRKKRRLGDSGKNKIVGEISKENMADKADQRPSMWSEDRLEEMLAESAKLQPDMEALAALLQAASTKMECPSRSSSSRDELMTANANKEITLEPGNSYSS
jgi:hypothetical protein